MERMEDSEKIKEVVESLLSDYKKDRDVDKASVFHQPDQEAVRSITQKMLRIIFPGYYRDKVLKGYNLDSNITVWMEDIIYNLSKQIALVLHYRTETEKQALQNLAEGNLSTKKLNVKRVSIPASSGDEPAICAALQDEHIESQARMLALEFCKKIPKIREYVDTDLTATLDGDPAALNKDEIILSYPGIMASTVNRIAHELFLLNIPLIPRMMTEYAHSITGIDIHPGATIGKYFFIDHGTGVVVGSTTIIGEHVKIYQGVTIGALSTSGGQSLRGIKRHPTIEDNVTIYSGASILGGETVIGKNSVIGSNAFITKSIPEGTRVTIKNQELAFRTDSKNGEAVFETEELKQDDTWFYMI
ncbi:MAG: serine acetyltransferase [Lachnospiraceae bacterium]|nr:serine acetyltransferase [Lachnospiraceae bacterium]